MRNCWNSPSISCDPGVRCMKAIYGYSPSAYAFSGTYIDECVDEDGDECEDVGDECEDAGEDGDVAVLPVDDDDDVSSPSRL
mmetsp:Transcript_156680/g.288878  ORF Transcript_156680/g.288878 Transcript_156680/m.288878 type:complete len:82 (+) Transcript_156680:290-535(+)